MTDINNISFQDINEEYTYGKYGDFVVIMMKKNGFINATKLCKNYSNKQFKHWLENKHSKELIEETINCNVVGIPTSGNLKELQQVIIKVSTSPINLTIIRGSYVHSDLIPHIAAWISPHFALKISKIINQYLITTHLQKLKETTYQIQIQNDLIQAQKEDIAIYEHLNAENEDYINMLCKDIIFLGRQDTEARNKEKELQKKLAKLTKDFNKLYEYYVAPPDNSDKMEYLVILKLSCMLPNFTRFYVLRRQEKTLLSAIKTFKISNKGASLFFVAPCPNSKYLYNKIKEHFTVGLSYNGNYLYLDNNKIANTEFLNTVQSLLFK